MAHARAQTTAPLAPLPSVAADGLSGDSSAVSSHAHADASAIVRAREGVSIGCVDGVWVAGSPHSESPQAHVTKPWAWAEPLRTLWCHRLIATQVSYCT